MNSRTLRYSLLVFLLLISAGICIWGINFGLPGLFHSDEQALVKRALRFGSGDLNPHFFYYPTLHMYFLFIAYGIFFVAGRIFGIFASVQEFAFSYIRDPSYIYLIGRSLSALPSVASVYLTYRIARRMFASWYAGIMAGIFFIAIPRVPTMSRVIKPDPMMVMFVLLFFDRCLEILDEISAGYDENNSIKNYILGGFYIGLASSLKYNAMPMFILIPVAQIIRKLRINGNSLPRFFRGFSITDVKKTSSALLLSAIGFTIGTPYWIPDFGTFRRHFIQMIDYTAQSQTLSDGSFQFFPSWLTYLKEMIFLGASLPFLGLLCAAGTGYYLFFHKNKDKVLLAVVSVLVFYMVCARQKIPGWWYLAPVFPLYASLGAGFVTERIKDVVLNLKKYQLKASLFDNKYTVIIAVAVTVLWTIIAVGNSMSMSINEARALASRDVRLDAREWIERNIPPGSKILLDQYGPPILRSKKLIRQQYELAVKLNNPKKDYFRLQMEAQQGVEYDYWDIERQATAPEERVRQSREVELMEPLPSDIKILRDKGFKYVILTLPPMSNGGENKTQDEEILDKRAKCLKEFVPLRWVPSHHFRIKIYAL